MSNLNLAATGAVLAAVVIAAWPSALAAQAGDEAGLEKQRCSKPSEFANVFSFGYAGDHMPKDDAKFEQLLRKISDAGFNTIHCTYTGKRLELCGKYGVKMMLDFLATDVHHVYSNVEAAKAVAEKLRGNPNVWGYNLWNDAFGKMGEGRRRDILNVRRWDPTHASFSGTYRTGGLRHLVSADVIAYYDYHWKRGTHYHFPHMLAFWAAARANNSCFYRWVESQPGLPGKGNFNRALYTANTSIACGLKGQLYFLATSFIDRNTLEWTQTGQDIIRVNKEIMPASREIMKIGNPEAIYSTPITRTLNNQPLGEGKDKMMPPGLENNAFPAGFWIKPVSGEFVMGVFKDDQGRDAVFVANHNAYAEQQVALRLSRSVKVSMFNRKEGKWEPTAVKGDAVSFKLDQAGGELIRFEK